MAAGVYCAGGSGRGSCHVEILSEDEIPSLLAVDSGDLTTIPYGRDSLLYMSREAQLDDDAPVNKEATVAVAKIGGVPVTIRGPAVAFPRGVEWAPLGGE